KSDDDGDAWPGWGIIDNGHYRGHNKTALTTSSLADTPAEGTWFPMPTPRVSGEWPPASMSAQIWSAVPDATGAHEVDVGLPQNRDEGRPLFVDGLPSGMEWFDLSGGTHTFNSPTDTGFFDALDQKLDAAPLEMRHPALEDAAPSYGDPGSRGVEGARRSPFNDAAMDMMIAPSTGALAAEVKTSHTFMLILVALLLLGVLGGIWFGYLLASAPVLHG
ncbi:MAG TPA: hypothetical protein VKR06_02270, partial [Ktedonosporobacter sp.]|nr:hypothetical protein [Ktedonosporobacter sp.]